MSATLVTNIGQLVTNEPSLGDGSILGIIYDAAFVIDGGFVSWIGDKREAPIASTQIDAKGRAVIPGFVDSHTHSVFAGDRLRDFVARMTGEKYNAGGIRTTVAATRVASVERLHSTTSKVVAELKSGGTTTFEIKSGYGLDVTTERKMLEVARQFTPETTFLGAHAIPAEFEGDRSGYLALVMGEMLDACAPYAKWIDVFCESSVFSPEEARAVLEAGVAKGLLPRLHGNQLGESGGVQLAVEMNAASVDHCTFVSDKDLKDLANSSTVATLLPGAEFSTRSPYPDARRFYEAGVQIALATDCNPGSSYISSMPWVIATAVREMFFTPAQALHAATAGGALALRRTDVGRLKMGSRADFVVLDALSYEYLAYRPGANLISSVHSFR